MGSPTIWGVFHAHSLSGTNWSYEVIDSINHGWNMDSTFDPAGNLHVSYYRNGDGVICYAVKSNGAWSSPSIVTNGGGPTSIAVDSQQKVHLAFCSGNNYGLWYATKTAAQWSFSKIDTNLASTANNAASMALDTNGIPHITYCDDVSGSGTRIRYFTKSGTNWLKETIAVGLGAANEIAVKPNGTPVVAFDDNGPFYSQLMIAERISGSWQTQRVNMATATNSTSVNDLHMTLDKGINPHIVYVSDETSGDAIHYAGLTGDRDGDQLTDWDEAYTYNTDPDNSDTDRDGIGDGQEVANGTDPLTATIPGPPISILATDGLYTNLVRVSWLDSFGASGYEVWRHSSNDTNMAIRIAQNLVGPHYDDTNITAEAGYYYWLKATNLAGSSEFSSSDYGYAHIPVSASLAGSVTYGGNQTGLIHVAIALTNSLDPALSLDGVDDGVVIAAPTATLQLATQMTMCAWVNVTGEFAGSHSTILCKYSASTAQVAYIFSLQNSSGRPYANLGDANTYSATNSVGPNSGWTHLAFTHNGTVGTWYINGQVGSQTNKGPVHRWGDGSLYMGRYCDLQDYFNRFPGQLDDVSLWSRALSQSEIQAVMSNGLSGSEVGLSGCWNFNDGTASDLTTNSNDGHFLAGAMTAGGRVINATYSTSITIPGNYSIADFLEGEYSVWAYRDSSGNGSNDPWEVRGHYLGNPLAVTGAMTGIDIDLRDPIADEDADGLADYDETYVYGTSWTNADTDADGMPDGDEVLAGSEPTNSESVFGFADTQPVPDDNRVVLCWPSLSNRVYRLERSTNLLLGFEHYVNDIPADPPMNSYTDDTPNVVGGYRIGVRME